MFLSCEDRAILRTLQIIESEKRVEGGISSFLKEKKDDLNLFYKPCRKRKSTWIGIYERFLGTIQYRLWTLKHFGNR
jgi:hypothetical protein